LRAGLPAGAQLPHRALDDALGQARHLPEMLAAIPTTRESRSVRGLDFIDVSEQLSLVSCLHR
jgi:hypothetical protein